MDNTFGSRLRFARQKWDLTQTELADKAGVNIATVQRAEWGTFDPRLSTAQKLADALQVRVEWLLTGDGEMVALQHMTPDQQHAEHNGPGSEGLPGYVVTGGGVWYPDEGGNWLVDFRKDRYGNE